MEVQAGRPALPPLPSSCHCPPSHFLRETLLPRELQGGQVQATLAKSTVEDPSHKAHVRPRQPVARHQQLQASSDTEKHGPLASCTYSITYGPQRVRDPRSGTYVLRAVQLCSVSSARPSCTSTYRRFYKVSEPRPTHALQHRLAFCPGHTRAGALWPM
jgi:hypothetical protein